MRYRLVKYNSIAAGRLVGIERILAAAPRLAFPPIRMNQVFVYTTHTRHV